MIYLSHSFDSSFIHSFHKIPQKFKCYLDEFALLRNFIAGNILIVQIERGGLEQSFCVTHPLGLIGQVRMKMLQF